MLRFLVRVTLGVLVAAGLATPVLADSLSLADARLVADAAVAEAKRLNAPGGAIAIADAGGHLVFLVRLDDTFPAGASVSADKARTAAQFKRATSAFEDAVKNGRVALTGVPQMLPLRGGVPLVKQGKIVGAIGVSGAASAEQDEEIAKVAAAVLEKGVMTEPIEVAFLGHDTVASAFRKGAPLLEVEPYKIHASRRDAAGQAEVHEKDTDIIYVLDGKATFVTGGQMVDGKMTATEELRGASIAGGETRTIVKGDVVVVPNGTPHWFKNVDGPFTYYVVKVRDAR